MNLDERSWVVSAGTGHEWRAVNDRRVEKALADLESIAAEFEARAPEGARRRRYLAGLRYFIRSRSPFRDRLASHPALDYWLFLWEKHFSAPCDESQWHLQFGLFQGFAAALALETGDAARFPGCADPDGHLHLYGSLAYVELPKALALAPLELTARAGGLEIFGPDGLSLKIPAKVLRADAARTELGGGARLRRWREVIPDLSAESCGFLTVQCVVMHGLARPDGKKAEDFARVLATALAHVEERDGALFEEMTDLTRVLIPLVNPVKYGSVSSSYVNARGAICLSHSKDPLLQAETLIHEFCHQKMNQLLLVDPILLPGQGGQVFYSPWRPDARRLRGLLLGAHAFLNVSRYLLRSLAREKYPFRARIAVMCNVARRLFEVDAALRSVCAYGEMTEFGRRFVLAMCRETQLAFHGIQWFPPVLVKEARDAADAHRKKHGLALTGFHRPAGLTSVRHMPFGKIKP